MNLPTFSTYCHNTTAVNALVFEMPDGGAVWYSYRTPVAFRVPGGSVVVRENDWGQTTGKHLNAIDRGTKEAKALRVPSEDFEAMLAKLGERCGVGDMEQACNAYFTRLSGNVMGCPVHGIARGVTA